MDNSWAMNPRLRIGAALAATLMWTLIGCTEKQAGDPSVDPFAPLAGDHAPDPVREAHERGWLSARQSGFTLVTDCLGLADPDERFGCATYVNNHSR